MLSDKIVALRRKFGWTQEELAEQLGVSRQSVSKWESGASLPDVDRVLEMSALFGVSTDYLLKDGPDELGEPPRRPEPQQDYTKPFWEASGAATATATAWAEPEPAEAVRTEPEPGPTEAWEEIPHRVEAVLRQVLQPDSVTDADGLRLLSDAEAHRFLENRRQCAPRIGLGAALCTACAAPLVALMGAAEDFWISERWAAALGLVALFAMIGAAVGLFVTAGMRMSRYDDLDREPFALSGELREAVEEEKLDYRREYNQSIVGGVVLCATCWIPVSFLGILGAGDMLLIQAVAVLLAMIAAGVFLFVKGGIIQDSFSHVLQEGKHSLPRKRARRRVRRALGVDGHK